MNEAPQGRSYERTDFCSLWNETIFAFFRIRSICSIALGRSFQIRPGPLPFPQNSRARISFLPFTIYTAIFYLSQVLL